MNFGPLEVIETPFHFGIGGLGDFLLLMSTFYDEIDDHTDVIFVANDMTTVRALATQFPKVGRFWLFPRKAFFPSAELWERIVSHEGCLGTGVTPKKFEYVKDWIECGKFGVFNYYGVKEHPDWCRPISYSDSHICIQPFGGADDTSKIKEISVEDVEQLIGGLSKNQVYLIGSEMDRTRFLLPENRATWVTSISEAYQRIRGAEIFIGADSWGKTVSCLAGVDTYVWENIRKDGVTPQEVFGHHVDPGDYVFLNGWELSLNKEHAMTATVMFLMSENMVKSVQDEIRKAIGESDGEDNEIM